MARRRKNLNFGTISIGSNDEPTPLSGDISDLDEKNKSEMDEKIKKYRDKNPEKPKSSKSPIQTPLSIKRISSSFDNEYIELAKRYLRIPENVKPTVELLSKKIIKLFEDNVNLTKRLNSILKKQSSSISSSAVHSWEHGGSWN